MEPFGQKPKTAPKTVNEWVEEKRKPRICASCGNPEEPHDYRHPFVPIEEDHIPYNDKIKLVRYMIECLDSKAVVEDLELIISEQPWAREAINKWGNHLLTNLLALVHAGKDQTLWS